MQGDPKLFENPSETKPMLTAQQVAELLKVDLKKVYRLVDAKEIPALRVGGQWRFIWEDVLGAIKQGSCYGHQG